MLNMTEIIRYIESRLGKPRFNFLTPDDIHDTIVLHVLPEFDIYYPYKTYFTIWPNEDAVDPVNLPGLCKIQPVDCGIEAIRDVGMCFSASDIAVGGYPRDLGRSVYGGFFSIGVLLSNQVNANMMSMVQPQQITCEYVKPNFVQFYPKQRFAVGSCQPVVIELFARHSDNLQTINDGYESIFRQLSLLACQRRVYDLYKDMEDETVAGHQVRTKIQEYSGADDKFQELLDKMDEDSFKNPDRIDLFYV